MAVDPQRSTDLHQVKGIWLVAARAAVNERFGAATLDRMESAYSGRYHKALRQPKASEYYPEDALQDALRLLDATVTRGDDEKFRTTIRHATSHAVSTVFRVFLRASTASFILRQVPTLWREVRRGPAQVRVTPGQGGAVLDYTDFPFFDERLYLLLTQATLEELLFLCTKRRPSVTIADSGSDWARVKVEYFKPAGPPS